jgi:hypothetical protein
MEADYAFVYKRWKRTDEVTRIDDKRARIETEFPAVSISASNQEQ